MIDTAASQTSSLNCIGVFFLNWWHPSDWPQCPIRQKEVNTPSSSQRSFLIILLYCQSVRLALAVHKHCLRSSLHFFQLSTPNSKKVSRAAIALEYYLLKKSQCRPSCWWSWFLTMTNLTFL